MSNKTSLPPKEEILEMVREQSKIENAREFARQFSNYGDYYDLIDWNDERSYGDGNERFATIHFKEYDLYVSLVGVYSSYGESTWDQIYVSRPYIHREVRYQAVEEKGQ